jgi:hypothetical protein
MRLVYHPQTDGQTKIVNKCLEPGYLGCYSSNKQYHWVKWLPKIEWRHNTTYHTSTKMSPFESLYEYLAPSISYFLQDHSKVEAIESHMEKTKETLSILKENIQMTQNKMKQQADQHQNER